jgi:photosystem II stability/assembly factor-like uncharacterized protein
MRLRLLLCWLLAPGPALAAQQWTALESNTRAEFRGLHAVNHRVVWAAGKGGVVSHTTDGGARWQADSIPGAEGLFLIAVHGRDAQRAWVAGTAFAAPSLARIYYTGDGGKSWTLQYENATKGVFFDGMAFWDARHGIAFSDPIEGRLLVVTTEDGGAHWNPVPPDRVPAMLPGEAAFAASGTAIVVRGKSEVWIGTGGANRARVLHSADRGKHWAAFDTPASASAAKGIFGIAMGRRGRAVAVGGDYQQASASAENLLLSDDGGRHWRIAPNAGVVGVQYGVADAGGTGFVTVGPGGSALTRDAGTSWTRLEGPGYNTVNCAKQSCWAAGTEGRIGRLTLP